MNILIMGGLGKTAEPIIELLLEQKHEVTVFDIAVHSGNRFAEQIRVLRGSVCEFNSVLDAMKGIDIVIHLAVNIQDICNERASFDTNVFGTYNVLLSAQINKVKKTIIASSAPVHVLEELDKVRCKSPFADYYCNAGEDFTYDLTKILQEVIAENFALTYNMHILVLRLGHIVNGEKGTDLHETPLSELMYCRGGWVCKYDVARAFLSAVESDLSGYQLLNIIGSYQASDHFDLQHTKEMIGFECAEKFLNIP